MLQGWRHSCNNIVISWLYRTCWNNLATSLIISTRLLQVVNSLLNLLTSWDKQCEHNLLTACWQTCCKMWDFYACTLISAINEIIPSLIWSDIILAQTAYNGWFICVLGKGGGGFVILHANLHHPDPNEALKPPWTYIDISLLLLDWSILYVTVIIFAVIVAIVGISWGVCFCMGRWESSSFYLFIEKPLLKYWRCVPFCNCESI
jgi:hypothetical protein